MDTEQWWELIETARDQVLDPRDGSAIAAQAVTLLSACPRDEIVASDHVLQVLMAGSYRNPLWAAAYMRPCPRMASRQLTRAKPPTEPAGEPYMINGGCSDDGFDYFRGWLIMQGHEVYQRVVAEPDTLADVPIIRAKAPSPEPVECEDTLYIVSKAYRAATGGELPRRIATIRHPELDPDWGFDFDDRAEMTRRLPRLAALFP